MSHQLSWVKTAMCGFFQSGLRNSEVNIETLLPIIVNQIDQINCSCIVGGWKTSKHTLSGPESRLVYIKFVETRNPGAIWIFDIGFFVFLLSFFTKMPVFAYDHSASQNNLTLPGLTFLWCTVPFLAMSSLPFLPKCFYKQKSKPYDHIPTPGIAVQLGSRSLFLLVWNFALLQFFWDCSSQIPIFFEKKILKFETSLKFTREALFK
jgi:hypothetical protein